MSSNSTDVYVKEIQNEFSNIIMQHKCAPILLRLAFHDAGTYDKLSNTGGPNGSIRLPDELNRDDNKGLAFAVNLCESIKRKHPGVSYADIYQLAGIVAVQESGGPTIPFTPGRKDSNEPSPRDRLPTVQLGDHDINASHLRNIFYRMGFNDKEIVVLSGAHTLGKAHRDRSMYDGPWTSNPDKFDNSYFIELLNFEKDGTPRNGHVLLPTDKCLVKDKVFRRYVDMYAKDNDLFFKDYSQAHKKMSELGFKQAPKPYQKSGGFTTSLIIVAIAIGIIAYYYGETIKSTINNMKFPSP